MSYNNAQYNKKNKLSNIEEPPLFSFPIKIVLFLLFIAGINFMNRFFYFVFIAFIICVFLKKEPIYFSSSTIWFFLFSISLVIFFKPAHASILSLIRCFTYPVCYIIGSNLFSKKDSMHNKEVKIRVICIFLALAPLIHMFLNYITNIENNTSREIVDIWLKTTLSATNQASFCCMMIGVSIALLFSHYSIKHKILSIIFLIIITVYNLMLAGRSIFVMIIIAVVLAAFYYIKTFSTFSTLFKVIIWSILAMLVIVILYSNDVFGLKTAFEDSNFYARFFGERNYSEIAEDSRGILKLEYLKNLAIHPWGGGEIHKIVGGYAHDLYLDTYDEAGIFAFIFILAISIDSIVKLYKILKCEKFSFEIKQMFYCLYIAMHLEFMIEPILVGIPWFLALFCTVHGMVSYISETTI